MEEYKKVPKYIVTALEEYDPESGLRIYLYEGDSFQDACVEVAHCSDSRKPSLYITV